MHIHVDRVITDVRLVSLAMLVKWYGEHGRKGLDYSLVYNTLWTSLDLTHASIVGIPTIIEALWEGAEAMTPGDTITMLDIRQLKRFIVELENTTVLHDQEVLIAEWDDANAK